MVAVARTCARSVVMSAGGKAADYYRRMNMNESGRGKSEERRGEAKEKETSRSAGRERDRTKGEQERDGNCGEVAANGW